MNMTRAVLENLVIINAKIIEACKRANRNPNEINIIAVTKYVSVNRAREAHETGLLHFGENYEEGLVVKYQELSHEIIWHYIGTLQSRKVKNIIDKVDYIHSLDRLSLVKELNKRATNVVKCFIQVNVSSEKSKHGIHPLELVPFIKMIKDYPFIKIVGLMTMAPNTEDKDIIRNCFRNLRKCRQDVQALGCSYAPCHDLSMGMSNDYEIAIEEGATFIRIGTLLVGE
jgi:pyridoxal phosphate enzyme (YggS family)